MIVSTSYISCRSHIYLSVFDTRWVVPLVLHYTCLLHTLLYVQYRPSVTEHVRAANNHNCLVGFALNYEKLNDYAALSSISHCTARNLVRFVGTDVSRMCHESSQVSGYVRRLLLRECLVGNWSEICLLYKAWFVRLWCSSEAGSSLPVTFSTKILWLEHWIILIDQPDRASLPI